MESVEVETDAKRISVYIARFSAWKRRGWEWNETDVRILLDFLVENVEVETDAISFETAGFLCVWRTAARLRSTRNGRVFS